MIEIFHRRIVDTRAPTDTEPLHRWACWLEITVDGESRTLPATAPGDLAEEDLQAYFDAQEDYLWDLAGQKNYELDVTLLLEERELFRRLLKLIMGEFNILRELHGLPPRTLAQLKRALRDTPED